MKAGASTRRGDAKASPGPLIEAHGTSCVACWECARSCPVRAIRIADDQAEIIAEKCVACGQCVSACGDRGFAVRDDTGAVLDLLRGKRPVVALLATEFIAALHPLTVEEIGATLDALGFHAIETTLLGEELVAQEYERFHARDDALLVLRSTCPVVVDFVRAFHPVLTGALAPIVPPYIAQAELIRELYPDDVAVVYVSPCFARKDEVRDPQFAGAVDVAIDFLELRRLISGAGPLTGVGDPSESVVHRPTVLKEISLTDGFPRSTLTGRSMADARLAVVRGLKDLDRLLTAIEAGEAAPRIVDMLNCEGCIDGPAVNPGLSVFAKRNIEMAAYEMPGITRVSTRSLLGVLPAVPIVRSFESCPLSLPTAAVEQIDRALREGGFTSRDAVLDCGSCGYDTCVEHAEAVIKGESTWLMCLPLQRQRLGEAVSANIALQTVDALTGLWNGRAFSERLALEVARYQRYGTLLSLALIDIDGLGAINEAYREIAGDAVLRALGEMLRGLMRRTDAPARLHTDRFALLLPGVNKTAAFAVAEKLRSELHERPLLRVVPGAPEGNRLDIDVTVCIGIASANPAAHDADALLAAADAALASAMAAGRDE
ncbi:MAG TPA: [Fe-Fe] hydrogenase large subunit C-terminal domain-containing protein, partial [Coriobacteriia bacterium]|nr:[Fe-Fe] hydrogenase large subunit C-terminal domain-containing protein [Coriobacteriia bacterium]